jgi:predicted flavoprotein YhiN
MARYWNDKAEEKTVEDDLAPYRRLVELQKQMIELAQQHELTKRRHDALREQMVREVTGRRPVRQGLRHRLQQSGVKFLKRVPGFATVKPNFGAFKHKQPSSC